MTLEERVKQEGIEIKCPVCGSKNVELRNTFFAKWYECLNCGYSSNPAEERDEDNQ